MAIRALLALLLILFLPHYLEASEADYIGESPEAAYIDYSGIEISQSYAIQLATAALKKDRGASTLPYTRVTAEKVTTTEFPEAYYDLEPGDSGGYTSFKVSYWSVGFTGPNLNPESVSVHTRTGETTVNGPQVDHFDASELRHGSNQEVEENGEWSLPVVKKSNETCVMVCNFDIPRYEAAQRAHDKARAVVEGIMGDGCCDPSDFINHIIVDAVIEPGTGMHRYYSAGKNTGTSWVLIDYRVDDGDVEDLVAHELGHYYQVRMNPNVFVVRKGHLVENESLLKHRDYRKIKQQLADIIAAAIVNHGASTPRWALATGNLNTNNTLAGAWRKLVVEQGVTFARATEIILKAVPLIKDDNKDGTLTYKEIMTAMKRVATDAEDRKIFSVFESTGLIPPLLSTFNFESYGYPSYGSIFDSMSCSYNLFGELGDAFMTCTPEPFFGF